MKGLWKGVLVLAVFACSPDALRLPVAPTHPIPPVPPSSPPVPSSSRASVWVLVVKDSGVCVEGATATVVRGQRLGQSVPQMTPCSVWDYGGGIVFGDLTPGVEMALRVSAAGYVTQEVTVLPLLGPYTAVELYPARIP
jgi:hypothetical protein